MLHASACKEDPVTWTEGAEEYPPKLSWGLRAMVVVVLAIHGMAAVGTAYAILAFLCSKLF
jgi:hypothetical protein